MSCSREMGKEGEATEANERPEGKDGSAECIFQVRDEGQDCGMVLSVLVPTLVSATDLEGEMAWDIPTCVDADLVARKCLDNCVPVTREYLPSSMGWEDKLHKVVLLLCLVRLQSTIQSKGLICTLEVKRSKCVQEVSILTMLQSKCFYTTQEILAG